MGLDYAHMAADLVFRMAITRLQLEDVAFDDVGPSCVTSQWVSPDPIARTRWRQNVLNAARGLSHPCKKPSQRLVAPKSVWQSEKTLKTGLTPVWNANTQKCTARTKAPLAQFPVP